MTWRGWLEITKRVVNQVVEDRISMAAGAVAFWAMLAIFPALLAAISVYGLVFDTAAVEAQLTRLAGYLPASAADLMGEQLRRLVDSSPDELGLSVLFGLGVGFWTASTGTASLLEAVNVAYDEPETRSYLQLRLQALRVTLVAILGGAGLLAALVGLEWLIEHAGLRMTLQWVVLFIAAIGTLSAIYRIGPEREPAKWRWVMPGALLATVIWLAASALFALYVRSIGDYEATYGALGGAIVLMLWLFATAYILLLGAEVNAELESQLARDTTTGAPAPIGERGAVKADEIGTPKSP